MKARWRWLWWTLTSWRRTRRDDDRPGTDDQFGTWPRIRVADLNLQDQQDDDERRWKP